MSTTQEPSAQEPKDGIQNIISEEIVEKIAKEALSRTFKRAGENLRDDFYDSLQGYLYEHFQNFEGDIWHQVSRQVIHGYANGRWNKYDHKNLRDTLLRENKAEIIKQLNQDLVEENEKLKKDLEFQKSLRY